MNGETDSSQQPNGEVVKKIPVSELLKRAGEAFDVFHDEYDKTKNQRILMAKMNLLHELPDECEKYGEDWDEYKDKILSKLHGLNKELAGLIEEGRFNECSDRVGYGHGANDRDKNICYELADLCTEKNENTTNV